MRYWMVVLGGGGIALSQVSLPNVDNFSIGETYYYHIFSPDFSGMGGTPTCGNNTWNLQRPSLLGKDTVSILNPASTPYGGGLPGGTVAMRRIRWKGSSPDTLYIYFLVSPTDNQLVRFSAYIPTIGRVTVNYSDYEKVIIRPLSYLGMINDVSSRSYTITLFGGPLNFKGECTYVASAPACGTLSVGNTSVPNVLKFVYSRNCLDSATTILGTQYVTQRQGGIAFYSSTSKAYLAGIDTVSFSLPSVGSIRDTNYEIESTLATSGVESYAMPQMIVWQTGNTIEVYKTPGTIVENGWLINTGGVMVPLEVKEESPEAVIFKVPESLPAGLYTLMLLKPEGEPLTARIFLEK